MGRATQKTSRTVRVHGARRQQTLCPRGLLVLTDPGHENKSRRHPPPHPHVDELRYPKGSLLVVAGAPAVGKTTLIERVLSKNIPVLCPDLIRLRRQAEAGVSEYDPAFWPATFAELEASLDAGLKTGETMVVHATCLSRFQQRQFSQYAVAHEREAHIIFLDANSRLCADGLSTRDNQIPDEKMEMYLQDWDSLKQRLLSQKTLDEGIVDDFDGADERTRRRLDVHGMGAVMMRARGYTSVAILNRAAVNTLQRIRFL